MVSNAMSMRWGCPIVKDVDGGDRKSGSELLVHGFGRFLALFSWSGVA